jgi:hypothetical protein
MGRVAGAVGKAGMIREGLRVEVVHDRDGLDALQLEWRALERRTTPFSRNRSHRLPLTLSEAAGSAFV